MTPEFMAAALNAYMDGFQIYQEDLSTYTTDEETGEMVRTSAHLLKHVLIGNELPSMQGFAVSVKMPIRQLRDMYNAAPEGSPWRDAVDLFRDFQESRIASAAAFDLINAGFAKDIMKQWSGWRTDTITLEDNTPKVLEPTEAGARIAAILHKVMPQQALAALPQATVVIEATPAAPAPEAIAGEIQKRRPRKVVT